MPASVPLLNPTVVMPGALARSFSRVDTWGLVESSYPDGSSQRRSLTGTSRKRWRINRRLTLADAAELADFFSQQQGSTLPFYFYDRNETVPVGSYDDTGVALYGRYSVRFEGQLRIDVVGPNRAEMPFELVEVL